MCHHDVDPLQVIVCVKRRGQDDHVGIGLTATAGDETVVGDAADPAGHQLGVRVLQGRAPAIVEHPLTEGWIRGGRLLNEIGTPRELLCNQRPRGIRPVRIHPQRAVHPVVGPGQSEAVPDVAVRRAVHQPVYVCADRRAVVVSGHDSL